MGEEKKIKPMKRRAAPSQQSRINTNEAQERGEKKRGKKKN